MSHTHTPESTLTVSFSPDGSVHLRQPVGYHRGQFGLTADEWAQFRDAIKAGRFDHGYLAPETADAGRPLLYDPDGAFDPGTGAR